MQKKPTAVILAAGSSTRTRPLTEELPKPLLPVANREILAHILDSLKGVVSRTVLVLGYRKSAIEEWLSRSSYKSMLRNKRLVVVEQRNQLGTAHALECASENIKGSFIVLMGDNIFSKKDIKLVAGSVDSMLAHSSPHPERFGVVHEKNSLLERIEEKPSKPSGNLVACGIYHLSNDFLVLLRKKSKSSRGEFELPDLINIYARKHSIRVVKTGFFLPVSYPWDLLDANEEILRNAGSFARKGRVERGATVRGKVGIGSGTVIRAGAYIEGPVVIGSNCKIGPNCYIRPFTSIGDNCKVGNAVEIKNSVLMSNVSVGHLSYIGDSVIGFNSNIGAGTITANLKHNNQEVRSLVKGELIGTGRRKLGAIIGSNAHTGIHTSIYPGRKIHSGLHTLPGQVVKEDVA